MSNTVTTGPMLLPVPIVGQELGPQYATDINSCMALISQHNHSTGEGNQITPSGLNINSALSFNGNPLTAVSYLAMTPQSAALPGASPTLSALYSVGSSLYYNDSAGNQVPIVVGGSVTGASGTITGLPSTPAGAGVNYNSTSKEFDFISSSTTPANIAAGSFILQNSASLANQVTLQAPPSLTSSYSITLPHSTSSGILPLVIDTAGVVNPALITSSMIQAGTITATNIATGGVIGSNIAAATILGSNVAAGTIDTSNMTPANAPHSPTQGGVFNITSATYAPVSFMTVGITTEGHPVDVMLTSDGGGNYSTLGLTLPTIAAGSYTGTVGLIIQRNNVSVYFTKFSDTFPGGGTSEIPASSIFFRDYGVLNVPGTYTYQVYMACLTTGFTAFLGNCILTAYEIR